MAKTIIHKILESKPGYVSKLMYRDKGTNNPVYQLRVDGYKSVNSVLIHMREYMVGKQKNADAVLAFIKARDGNRFSRNSAGQIRRTRYSKKEVKLFDQVRKLNHRESPEAIRQASNVIR